MLSCIEGPLFHKYVRAWSYGLKFEDLLGPSSSLSHENDPSITCLNRLSTSCLTHVAPSCLTHVGAPLVVPKVAKMAPHGCPKWSKGCPRSPNAARWCQRRCQKQEPKEVYGRTPLSGFALVAKFVPKGTKVTAPAPKGCPKWSKGCPMSPICARWCWRRR